MRYDMAIWATELAGWFGKQGMSMAESTYLLSGMLIFSLEQAFTDVKDRPKQFVAMMQAIEDAGDLMANLVLLARARPGELRDE